MGAFGVSQAVTRREDDRLLTGQGRFVDDAAPVGLAHGFILRAPVAHARIASLEVDEARAAPGVLAVVTGADLAADGIGGIPVLVAPEPKPGTAFHPHPQPALVTDRVRFVGDAVAFVVAESLAQARDAAELIAVDYETGEAATDCHDATLDGAAVVWPDAPRNLAFEWECGDAAATEAAFAKAAHAVSLRVVNNRVVLSAIETRGAVASYDGEADKFTLTTGTQMPNSIKEQLVEQVFDLRSEQVRVLVEDVGGGFGGKNSLFPDQVLCLYAARKLARPVKWIGDRSDAFISDFHGRDNVNIGELALDAEGRFLALRLTTYANLGAYIANRGVVSPLNGTLVTINCYDIPAIYVHVLGVYTHTVPTDPYRGAGRPEVLYLVERLVDTAAHDLGLDRVELRRRNYIPADAFPYATPTGLSYDSAEFEANMDLALKEGDWAGFEARRAEARARGRLRGIGMANYIERCGGGGGLDENAILRFDADGVVTLLIGSMANGQGHETAYSQIVNECLDVPFEKIRVVQGDTDRIATGTGTGGSWSIPMGGGAVWGAADEVIAKARALAAHFLEAAEVDLSFEDGSFRVAGTDLRIGLDEVAKAAHDPARLPPGSEPGLEGEHRFVPENHTFPYGCHIAEVEVDPETGQVALVAYLAVHDYGRALNPLLLAGQVHGGLAQGIGQALTEHTVYGADGQLLAGSFMDYGLPRADDLPAIGFTLNSTPTTRNPMGVKGCGESGAAGSPPAVMNALVDALRDYGVRHLDMPATPARVWAATRAAERG
ncbi:MAG: xanthine dehydrogenase family protein molybdopterin-binding subunit [Alphaproteobacteria bacterium]|jgi:carbon-monoxide dehydrogenase large subunit|nr:xanthine dehydrogenase family protein molybdopterin-binding subunit [Alphaproteobacteria bacterium]